MHNTTHPQEQMKNIHFYFLLYFQGPHFKDGCGRFGSFFHFFSMPNIGKAMPLRCVQPLAFGDPVLWKLSGSLSSES